MEDTYYDSSTYDAISYQSYSDALELHQRVRMPSPPTLPSITRTQNYDTLRRKRNSDGTYGRRTENLYDSNILYQRENTIDRTCNVRNENHFLNLKSLQIAETNNGPLVRRRKVCGIRDTLKDCAVEDLVHKLNTQKSSSTDENGNSDLVYYITLTLIPNLKRDSNLQELLTLMSANNLNVKNVSAQAIQNIILQMPLMQLSDRDCNDIFMKGLKILMDEFCKVKNNANCASLLEALLLQFLACIFIWMLHSNSYDSNVSALVKIISEKENKMAYQSRTQSLDKIVVESFLSSGMTVSIATVAKSSLRIPEWEGEMRDKSTKSSIVRQFGDLSFIEQIACVLLLVNTSIRRNDFDKTLRLLNNCITSLPSGELSDNDRSLLFFVDWIVTSVLKWYETDEPLNINFERKQEIESELLDILSTVYVDDVNNRKESFVFHEKNEIRKWALEKFVLSKTNTGDNLVHVCHRHLEQSLIRLNLEIEPIDHTISDLTSQPQWMETKCRLFGTFCKLKLLLPSTKCLQGNAYDNYKSRADQQNTKYYINELDILTKLEEYEGHKNVVELLVHQSIPYPLYFILCDHDSENLQSHLLRKRQEKKPIPLKTLLEIILQALKAVDFLHDKGIVHRNIMAAAFGICVGRDDDMIQLCDFKLAKILWNEGEQPRKQHIDLSCEDIPTRWSSPESLTQGIFSRMSDSWMLFMTAVEVLEHGRWPLTDHHHSLTGDVIENMLFNDGRIHDNTYIPQQIYKMILDGTENSSDARLELPKFEELLSEFISKLPCQTASDVYHSASQTWKLDSTIPNLSKVQIECNSVPEKGIPASVKKFRKTDRDPEEVFFADKYISRAEKPNVVRVVTDCDITWVDEPETEYEYGGQNMLIEETVFQFFLEDVLPNFVNLEPNDLCITPWPPKPFSTENTIDGEYKLRYTIPESSSFLEMCIHRQFGHTIEDIMEPIYKLALLVDSFHEAGWFLNCLRAKNIRVTGDRKVLIPRLGRIVYNKNASIFFDYVKHEVPSDMKHWLPYEAIENHVISIYSDVYSFGMVISELCAILSTYGPRYEDDVYEFYEEFSDGNPNDILKEKELNCVPFGHVDSDVLPRHLKEGHIPKKHSACPEWLYEIMTKCWEFQRFDRPTMKEIIQDLKPYVKNHNEIKKPVLIRNPVPDYNRQETYFSAHGKNVTSGFVHPKLCNDTVTGRSQQLQSASAHSLYMNNFEYSYSSEQSASISEPKEEPRAQIDKFNIKNIEYSYSSEESASISEPEPGPHAQMQQKRTYGSYGSSTKSSSSGRIRPKKKMHKSIFEQF